MIYFQIKGSLGHLPVINDKDLIFHPNHQLLEENKKVCKRG